MLLAQLSMRKRCASAPEQSLKPRSQLPGARPYMSYRANSRTDRVLSENLCVEGECYTDPDGDPDAVHTAAVDFLEVQRLANSILIQRA